MKCQRSGCDGEIIDGVCEDCGRPPVGTSVLSNSQPSTASIDNGTFATGTGSSNRTGTTGSAKTAGSRRTSRSGSQGSSSRRQAVLGGGMVSLPPSPKQDPLKMVMEKPEVPLNKRVCPSCDAKVKREKGFCGACGAEYNYIPSLKTGDVVNGKFEVKG